MDTLDDLAEGLWGNILFPEVEEMPFLWWGNRGIYITHPFVENGGKASQGVVDIYTMILSVRAYYSPSIEAYVASLFWHNFESKPV